MTLAFSSNRGYSLIYENVINSLFKVSCHLDLKPCQQTVVTHAVILNPTGLSKHPCMLL